MKRDEARNLVADLIEALGAPLRFGTISAHVVSMLEDNGLAEYYKKQIEWSKKTFGPEKRTKGLTQHIRKELLEIEAKPDDLEEWLDVVILGMDGYWRHGGTADDFMAGLLKKQQKNFARKWPKPTSEDAAVEHDRSEDA